MMCRRLRPAAVEVLHVVLETGGVVDVVVPEEELLTTGLRPHEVTVTKRKCEEMKFEILVTANSD